MPLGLATQMNTGEGGEFTPLIMYMAREGRFYRRDRVVSGTAGFENEDTEVPVGSKMAFDFGSIAVGYLRFVAGQAPSIQVAPLGQPRPKAPDAEHRQGFRVYVHLGANGGKREFATTAKTVIAAIDDLHTEYEAAPEAKTGRIPVVEFTGAQRIVTENKHGSQTNFRPTFKIVQWINRPADLGERTVAAPGDAPNRAHNGGANTRQATQQAPQRTSAPADVHQPGGGDPMLNDEIPF